MIIILISFLNLSLRGVSHAEFFFLTQRRGGRRSTQREKLTQRNGGNGGSGPWPQRGKRRGRRATYGR